MIILKDNASSKDVEQKKRKGGAEVVITEIAYLSVKSCLVYCSSERSLKKVVKALQIAREKVSSERSFVYYGDKVTLRLKLLCDKNIVVIVM